jgi:hypothetical protein
MIALREHLYSLDFTTHSGYAREQTQHAQCVVLDMIVQVCPTQKPVDLIHHITAQLEPMKTTSRGKPMARGERILRFLKVNGSMHSLNARAKGQVPETLAEKVSISKSKRLTELLSHLKTAY